MRVEKGKEEKMSDNVLWKYSDGTKSFLAEVLKEIQEIKDDLTDGSLLLHSDNNQIVKEYALNIGKLDGLKVLVEKLTINDEESQDDVRDAIS